MTDPRAKVTLDGDVGPLRQKLREATQGVQAFGSQVGDGVKGAAGPLDALKGKFLAISAFLAGGALFGKAIGETAAYANASIQLGKSLGQSAGEASVWINVLEDAGVSTEELGGAAKGLLKNLQADEKGLNAMGLATRDATGRLRGMNEMLVDGIKIVNQHAEGTDRNVAARQIFGKSVDASSNLLKINSETFAENAELMEKLGLTVGQNLVDNYKAFDDAQDKSALVIKGLKTAIGSALMPVLTKLGEWFVDVGPTAVLVTRGAIGGLVSVFWGLKNAVTITWEYLKAFLATVNEPLRAISAAFLKLMKGDFAGAAEELKAVPKRIGEAWSEGFAKMVASSAEARDKIEALFMDGPPAAAAPKGGTAANPGKDNKASSGAAAAVVSSMQYYELLLAKERQVASERDALREYTKEEELAYWQTLLAEASLAGNDRLAIARKVADLEVQVRRKGAQQQADLDEEFLRRSEVMALAEVDAKQAAAQIAFENKQIDHDKLLRLELDFERQRYVIQRKALADRMKLAMDDPNTSPAERERLQTRLLELDKQHEINRIQALAKLNQNTKFDSAFGAFGDMFGAELEAVLLKAQTWQQAMGNIARQTGMIFLQEVVTKPFATYVASLAKMLMVKLGFLGQETTAQAAASTATVGIKAVEGTAVIGTEAAKAGAGSFAALAGIPIVGPALGAAAMVATFAAVMALMSSVKSARGGYDIPSGLNPMVQLHEEEMVLPKQFANVIRQWAGGGDGSRGGGGAPVHIHGEKDDTIKLRDLPRVLKQMHRDNRFTWVTR